MKYTKYGYRLRQITKDSGYTWLLLPAGPGLGADYLLDLCNKLHLPGAIVLLDFPKDGTNTQGKLGIKYWQDGLIDLLRSFKHPILVTHSFSGMFALNLPELQHHLAGLVLMNTTTENSFYQHVSAMQQKHQLPDLVPAASQYHLAPSNETYKEFWDIYKYYCFTPEEMSEGKKVMTHFAFNSAAYYLAIEHFYPNFTCPWFSEIIPTMIIASENDFICPPYIFLINEKFQRENIIHKTIRKAGHYPWLIYMEQVQHCFDYFVAKMQLVILERKQSDNKDS